MIITITRVEFDPEALDALQPVFDDMARASWEESGCLSYSVAVESRSDGICTVVERWKTEAALHAHMASPTVQTFKERISYAVRSVDARIYDVANERDLTI